MQIYANDVTEMLSGSQRKGISIHTRQLASGREGSIRSLRQHPLVKISKPVYIQAGLESHSGPLETGMEQQLNYKCATLFYPCSRCQR